MSEYRRAHVPGSSVFITMVTYQRQKLFVAAENIDKLRQACAVTIAEKPFTIEAAVILPEHIHFLWRLPPDDSDYSYRVGRMKVLFTRALRGVNALPKKGVKASPFMGKLNIALGMISILYPSAQADATRTGRGHCSLFTVH